MTEVVLDASALLALLQKEKGADIVSRAIHSSSMSAVNLAEVAAKSSDHGVPLEELTPLVYGLPLKIIPFDADQAYLAGSLRSKTRHKGLSLGDRCCLALGLKSGVPVLTTEKEWETLEVGVTIKRIR